MERQGNMDVCGGAIRRLCTFSYEYVRVWNLLSPEFPECGGDWDQGVIPRAIKGRNND